MYACLCIAVVWDAKHLTQTQPDGSPAFDCECGLIFIGVVGIEDPLRDEVAPAIQKCYTAVRLKGLVLLCFFLVRESF